MLFKTYFYTTGSLLKNVLYTIISSFKKFISFIIYYYYYLLLNHLYYFIHNLALSFIQYNNFTLLTINTIYHILLLLINKLFTLFYFICNLLVSFTYNNLTLFFPLLRLPLLSPSLQPPPPFASLISTSPCSSSLNLVV